MSEITHILESELNRINQMEKRDNKIRFNPYFIKEKKGLYTSMCLLFILTLAVLISSSIFSTTDIFICILIFVLMNAFFFLHITPSYHLQDIGKTALKNCYTGEWFREIEVDRNVIARILQSDKVNNPQKDEITRLLKIKKEIFFIDLYQLADLH